MQREKSYIDNLNRNIFPFVECPGYDSRYPAHSYLSLSEERLEEIREAGRMMYRVFKKTAEVFQNCPEEFMEAMEMPAAVRPYLNVPNKLCLPTWLSRFDFVADTAGRLKLVELNSDTPAAVVESFYANEIACRYFGKENPNEGEYRRLKEFLYGIYREFNNNIYLTDGGMSTTQRPFLFTCFDDYLEDYGTTMFLMNAMKEAVHETTEVSMSDGRNICFEPLYNLLVDRDGIVLPNGEHPGAVYRMHPMEIFVDEKADDGTPIGLLALDAYKSGRFGMFNPPEAIIMQSKSFQALVWALAHSKESHGFFSQDELSAIEKYMLPSYFPRDFGCHRKESSKWIRKPVWGREGRNISVISNTGQNLLCKEVSDPDSIVCRDSRDFLYQEFVSQKQLSATTDEGVLMGFVTVSTFMLGKEPSAVYCRFSPEEIAGTEAYWLPLVLEQHSDI